MATPAQWIEGARPRTLGAAVAPVLVGTAVAATTGPIIWWRAVGALVVAVAFQIGVNYANDYSDGVRGTDAERRGPLRLTASGLAAPAQVRLAGGLSLLVGAAVGLVLALAVNPWLIAFGAVLIVAAVLYTGGPRPYGYAGLGEVMVLACFGFAATVGTTYVQGRGVPAAAWWGSLVTGLPACAVLLANNVRDVATDVVAGKRTLAVRIGATRARRLFVGCLAGAFVALVPIAVDAPAAALGFLAAPLAVPPARAMLTRTDAPGLIAALVGTVRLELVLSALVAIGLFAS
ncbi:MAG: 1,4-dihydroxy-2-naphthoate polyprenyltransferase [Actinomycetes bacterium]